MKFGTLWIFWSRYKRNKIALIGLIYIASSIFITVIAPIVSPYPPLRTRVGKPFMSLCFEHIMGTDDLGRDVFSGVLYGTRTALLVGLISATISAGIGALVGAICGYYGGLVDDILMRITEAFIIIPNFLLALLVVAFFGSSMWNIIFVIAILSWPSTARLVRGAFISLREKEFVEACRALGASDITIIFGEILPNALFTIVVSASLQIARAIMIEAGLSYFGLADPSVPSWGKMLRDAQEHYRRAWWMALFPGLALFSTAVAFNVIGDGLNDALNPRVKGKRR